MAVKANHDVLALNTEGSNDYHAAVAKFREVYGSDDFEVSSDIDYMLEVGFEYGFWAAAKILTGYSPEHGE